MTCIGGLLNTVTGSVILTADEVKEVEGHIDQLNAENARLRSCLSDDAENAKLIMAENAKLRELAQRLLTEYRYLRVRPRKTYLEHERRMRAIEDEMRSLGIEVTP